jgi:citrate lyase alpha subunit
MKEQEAQVPKAVQDELSAKRSRERNQTTIKNLQEAIRKLETGEALSVSIYMRLKNGDSTVIRSYSDTPEADAGELMAMAMDRVSFTRDE